MFDGSRIEGSKAGRQTQPTNRLSRKAGTSSKITLAYLREVRNESVFPSSRVVRGE
jgi:hypothetical protein